MTSFHLAAVQEALREEGLDGWLLYDYRGSNPIARSVTGVERHTGLTSRRWYYLIPATGEALALVHDLERDTLKHLPGRQFVYSERADLEDRLDDVLRAVHRVAMEYSPGCRLPNLSRIDAGTLEQVRARRVEVVSSGDLVQRFEAAWDKAALDSHRTASKHLHDIKDRAFDLIRSAFRSGVLTEYRVQQEVMQWLRDAGLVSKGVPMVASQQNSNNPHYSPTSTAHQAIGVGELVLLDLWGKLPNHGAVYADITWVCFTGSRPPEKAMHVFGVARDARDAAVALVEQRVGGGRDIRGWEVDRAARDVVTQAGYGDWFFHRTGHSLGEELHGNGVNMDDYETRDERRLLSGTGFTIEPGIYLPHSFGVRTEINLHVSGSAVAVTGPRQSAIVPLA